MFHSCKKLVDCLRLDDFVFFLKVLCASDNVVLLLLQVLHIVFLQVFVLLEIDSLSTRLSLEFIHVVTFLNKFVILFVVSVIECWC